jgi:intracellular septation protein A
MTVGTATLIVSLVIVFAQGLGALLNNSRYVKVKIEMLSALGDIRERIGKLEVAVRNRSARL